MENDISASPLTEEQMVQICSILSVGCDRETAAGIAECSVADIRRAIAELPQFAIKVRRAEANAELRHMNNILNATKDGKYWRASVWWLERRSPERFARRPAGAITSHQLKQAVVAWSEVLQQEFDSPADQQRISTCLEEITESIELLLDAHCASTLLHRSTSPLTLDSETPHTPQVQVDGDPETPRDDTPS
jgi:hypothetical protein